MLECSNCFSRKLVKHPTFGLPYSQYKELYLCRGCGASMNINQVIVSKLESAVELSNDYWVSKDGKRYEFENMSADYLKNCIELLKRSYDAEELKDSNLFVGLTQEYMLR